MVVANYVVRRLIVIVDLSVAVLRTDFLPDRRTVLRYLLPQHIRDYLQKFTLSYCAVIATHDGVAEIITPFTMSVEVVLRKLNLCLATCRPSGDPSIENSLKLVLHLLESIPLNSAVQEVLYIASSLKTHDPGDIDEILDILRKKKLTFHVIGFGAQIHVLSCISRISRGSYSVPLHEHHLKKIFHNLLRSPGKFQKCENDSLSESTLIEFAFPKVMAYFRGQRIHEWCICHQSCTESGVECPKCGAYLCSTPPFCCMVCGIDVVPSSFVARARVQQSEHIALDHDTKVISLASSGEPRIHSILSLYKLMVKTAINGLNATLHIVSDGLSTSQTTPHGASSVHPSPNPDSERNTVAERDKMLLTVYHTYCSFCNFPFECPNFPSCRDTMERTDLRLWKKLDKNLAWECVGCHEWICHSCLDYVTEILLHCPNCR